MVKLSSRSLNEWSVEALGEFVRSFRLRNYTTIRRYTFSKKFRFQSLFAWFPDGKWVVTDGLTLLSTETAETRRLTSSPTKSLPDISPAVSPDGRTVAFSRSTSFNASGIYLLDLSEDLKPNGEARLLSTLKGFSYSPAWTPNGREIIFTSGSFPNGTSLWKVSASGAGEPMQLSFTTGGEVGRPAISRSGSRLAYDRRVQDSNIWRLSLAAPGVASGPPIRLIASTRSDSAAQYSPDGKRIAFESDRTGVKGVWVCDSDGSHIVELFSKAGARCGTARWSPDGQRIAFDFDAEGNPDINVIGANGGKPIRLTTHSADNTPASWSRDGKWVYFGSNRTGRMGVWKIPAEGGKAVQVTRNGGETAFESPDGKSIYYTKELFGPSGLWRMPLSGGEESQVLPSVSWRAFFPVKDGIYFIPGPSADRKSSIQFLSFTTAKVKMVATISGFPEEGLSVSPDGRFILFSQIDGGGSDLMLVENFR